MYLKILVFPYPFNDVTELTSMCGVKFDYAKIRSLVPNFLRNISIQQTLKYMLTFYIKTLLKFNTQKKEPQKLAPIIYFASFNASQYLHF